MSSGRSSKSMGLGLTTCGEVEDVVGALTRCWTESHSRFHMIFLGRRSSGSAASVVEGGSTQAKTEDSRVGEAAHPGPRWRRRLPALP